MPGGQRPDCGYKYIDMFCIYIYEVRKIPPMMVTLMKASATTFYQIFMLHEGDALTEGKTRKTEGTRKQLRKDLATF